MEHAEPGYRDVEPEEAVKAIREGSVQVLDVRTPEEYRELGHIPGALLGRRNRHAMLGRSS